MVVFDTFALVKFLKKEAGWERVAQVLKREGWISDATLYELVYVVTRDFLEQGNDLSTSLRKAQDIVATISSHLQKVRLSDEVVYQATYFKVKYSKLDLSHFDCIGLATAKIVGKPLFSGEKGLAQVKEVTVLG